MVMEHPRMLSYGTPKLLRGFDEARAACQLVPEHRELWEAWMAGSGGDCGERGGLRVRLGDLAWLICCPDKRMARLEVVAEALRRGAWVGRAVPPLRLVMMSQEKFEELVERIVG